MARSREFNMAIGAVVALVAAVAPPAALGDEVRKWRDADGKLHYSVTGSTEGAPAEGVSVLRGRQPAEDEKFSVQASLRRRAIEDQLRSAGRALDEIRAEIQKTEAKSFSAWVPAVTGDARKAQAALDAQRDALLAASQFESEKTETLRRLRRRERDRLKSIMTLWKDFDVLGAEVLRRYAGSLPTWWRPRLNCGACPSAAQAMAALRGPQPTPTPGGADGSSPQAGETDDEDWDEE